MSPTYPTERMHQWELAVAAALGLDPTKVIDRSITTFNGGRTVEWDEWDEDAKARVHKGRTTTATERKQLARTCPGEPGD